MSTGNTTVVPLKEISTISVLGCGWLGLPLAGELLDRGYLVKGSVTATEKIRVLRERGVEASVLVLNETFAQVGDPGFFDTDLVIVSVPPRRTNDVESVFPGQMKKLIGLLEQYDVARVIFISSTSVYPDGDGTVREEDARNPEKASGRALLAAERMFFESKRFRTTVVRFGGLIGADRNPARFLSSRREIPDGSRPVNLIHRDDCIRILTEIVRQEAWGEIFNACCPVHPSRREFYRKASEVSGLPLPEFSADPCPVYKTVDSSKLISRLRYAFIYSNPLEWLDELSKAPDSRLI